MVMSIRPDLIVGAIIRMTCEACDGRGQIKAWSRRDITMCGLCTGRGERDVAISLRQLKRLLDEMED